MNGVVRANQQLGAASMELCRRRKKHRADVLPPIGLDVPHVLRERVGVDRYFGMHVPTELSGAFSANRPIAKGRSFRTDGDDPDVS
jgi:hypothetical protein